MFNDKTQLVQMRFEIEQATPSGLTPVVGMPHIWRAGAASPVSDISEIAFVTKSWYSNADL
jgi:hypothetical protein